MQIAIEDGVRDGKKLGAEKKAKLTIAQRVARQKKIFRIARVIAFVLGTSLFVATALVVIGLGLPAWLVWAWAFVFWMRWQVKISKNSKIQREEWAEALQK